MKPVITVKEARKLLGKDAETISDVEIEELILNLEEIARWYIRGIREGTIIIPDKE